MIPRLLKQRPDFFILTFLIIILSPVISFADANRIFKENSKAVVVIVTYDEKGNPISQGSGFIVRTDGAIVTNYHVISNAKDIKVKAGKNVLDVEGLIHTDKDNDLVILKVKGQNLPIIKLGDIEKASVGEKVYVISSPRGFENTISDGILSGIRDIEGTNKKILQITAPVSPGSSGGAVFNKHGEVIGIATFIIEAQNLCFAMPVNLIKDKISSKKVTALKDSEISEIEDYKKSAEFWFYLGLAYGNLGMYKEAMEALKQAIKIKPDYAEAHYNLGVAYAKLGMDKEAIEAYKQAIKIKPDYGEAYSSLGITYVILDRGDEAIDAFKEALRLIKFDHFLFFFLGEAYLKINKNTEALETLQEAIKLKPDFAEAHFDLGFAYGKLDMYKEAIEAYKQAIKIKPDLAKAHYNLGAAYANLGMYREAIEAFKQAIRIKPDDAEAHYNLGLAYLIVNDRGSALEEYKILKELDKERANKLFNVIYE